MSSEEASTQETNAETSFTEKGVFKDEVTLIFDDERELFVSESFLTMSSPVFKAMFSNDFIEKNEMSVRLPGKHYDDFLEFLMCIHPAIQKAVDESNVESMVTIADEYQVPSIVAKCKTVMKTIADMDLQNIKKFKSFVVDDASRHIVGIRKCLTFLNIASTLGYKDIVVYFAYTLAKYPSASYMEVGTNRKSYIERAHSDVVRLNEKDIKFPDVHKECLDLFAKLPTEVRLQVASKRLKDLENLVLL